MTDFILFLRKICQWSYNTLVCGMLVDPTDIISNFPAGWRDHRHTLSIELIGVTLVLRFKISDLNHLDLNSLVAKIKQLDKKEPETLECIKDLIFHRLENLVYEQSQIMELASRIVLDVKSNVPLTKGALQNDARILRSLLISYGEAAKNAGWNKWLTLCEGYAEQL